MDIAVFLSVVALAVWGAASRGWVERDPEEWPPEWDAGFVAWVRFECHQRG